jgi:hypothetical protein
MRLLLAAPKPAVSIVTVCAALLLAGCSGSTDGTPGSVSAPPTSAAPASATSPSATSQPPSPASATTPVPPSALTPSLLSAAEVGADFVASTPTAKTDPLPCTPTKPPLETQVPSADKAKAVFANSAGTLALQETVLAYTSAGTASKALTVAKGGLACTHGTVDGEGINIAGPNDVRRSITARVSAAYGWVVTTTKYTGTIVAVQVGPKLVTLEFAATSQMALSGVDGKQIIETAVAKVINGH